MVAGVQLDYQVQGSSCWSPARISDTRHVVAGVQLEYQVQGSGCWSPARIACTSQWLMEPS